MTTQVLKKETTNTDISQETSKFSLIAIITMASLVSIWSFVCLAAGLANSGAGNMIKGYITTIFG
ncbi:hypothetical protein [Desulfogranum mediterraneum]|uniref:hypothetical protein n=1 Tax=Desulfogranum mediterraneum TaxID=160661 RepID=UPI000490CA10|nr:hypothetical protein [Desulfogranum mediterraneum]